MFTHTYVTMRLLYGKVINLPLTVRALISACFSLIMDKINFSIIKSVFVSSEIIMFKVTLKPLYVRCHCLYIQGVPGGMDETPGECSLC